MNSRNFCFLITQNKKETSVHYMIDKTQKEFLRRMKKIKYLRVQSRSDICAGNASTRLRRHGARSFLRSLEVLSPRRSTLALREIIARGRARSRAVFDCGKLAAAARKAPVEEHRRTSCIMCKSWPPVPIIISLLFLLGSFYFAPWTRDAIRM